MSYLLKTLIASIMLATLLATGVSAGDQEIKRTIVGTANVETDLNIQLFQWKGSGLSRWKSWDKMVKARQKKEQEVAAKLNAEFGTIFWDCKSNISWSEQQGDDYPWIEFTLNIADGYPQGSAVRATMEGAGFSLISETRSRTQVAYDAALPRAITDALNRGKADAHSVHPDSTCRVKTYEVTAENAVYRKGVQKVTVHMTLICSGPTS